MDSSSTAQNDFGVKKQTTLKTSAITQNGDSSIKIEFDLEICMNLVWKI